MAKAETSIWLPTSSSRHTLNRGSTCAFAGNTSPARSTTETTTTRGLQQGATRRSERSSSRSFAGSACGSSLPPTAAPSSSHLASPLKLPILHDTDQNDKRESAPATSVVARTDTTHESSPRTRLIANSGVAGRDRRWDTHVGTTARRPGSTRVASSARSATSKATICCTRAVGLGGTLSTTHPKPIGDLLLASRLQTSYRSRCRCLRD